MNFIVEPPFDDRSSEGSAAAVVLSRTRKYGVWRVGSRPFDDNDRSFGSI